MDRVLLDGTTLAFAARMLAGKDQPSALHVYALGLLVESAILHEQVIVLDTSEDGRILEESAETYGAGAVTIERRRVDDVVTEYVEREYPELEGLGSLDSVQRNKLHNGTPEQRDAIRRAGSHLTEVLQHDYSGDPEMQEYITLLDVVHSDQLQGSHTQRATGLAGLLPRNWFAGSSSSTAFPINDGTPLGRITSEPPMTNAWENFMRSYTSLGGKSAWEYHRTLASIEERKFRPSLLVRTHFYVLASQVLEAPYRPDGFRAPICWKFFREGSFAELAADEAFVRAAERAQQEEDIQWANRLLQRRAFVGLPFFLARVFQESREASDVMQITREIRESRDARRFREYGARLRRDEEAGNVREIVREMQAVSALLRKEFGGSERSHDVLLSLAGASGKAAITQDPASLLDLGIKSGTAARKGAAGLGAWWRNRKLALISKTVKQARRAMDLQGELRKLFSVSLSDSEIDVISHLEQLGRHSHELSSA